MNIIINTLILLALHSSLRERHYHFVERDLTKQSFASVSWLVPSVILFTMAIFSDKSTPFWMLGLGVPKNWGSPPDARPDMCP